MAVPLGASSLWTWCVSSACQVLVDGRKDGHAQAEVAGPEQRLALLGAEAAYVVAVVLQPAGAAGHHLDAGFEGAQVVAVGGLRVGKLYGDVGAPEGFRVEILLVVQVDDAHDFMSTAAGDAFYLLAHFAVAYQCCYLLQR